MIQSSLGEQTGEKGLAGATADDLHFVWPQGVGDVSSGGGPGWPLPSLAGAPLGEPSSAHFADP